MTNKLPEPHIHILTSLTNFMRGISSAERLRSAIFLRELREVVPEMELFSENYSLYEKDFVTKLIYIQSFQLAIL